MLNNDVLRGVRYILGADHATIAGITRITGGKLETEDVHALLKKEEEEGYQRCDDERLAYFLDGLVIHRRGQDESRPQRPIDVPMTNNMVLKKLRVAFGLLEQDMHDVLKAAGFAVSKPELSALFRKPGSKNYRECGDQLLRYFLKGLAIRYREAGPESD